MYGFFLGFTRNLHAISILSKSFCGRLLWFETSTLKLKSCIEIQREYTETVQELLKQSHQVDSSWHLSVYLLSVHRMTSVIPCFSSPVCHHLLDLRGGHRILPELFSAGIPAHISQLGNYSSQKQLECIGRIYLLQVLNNLHLKLYLDTYLFTCFEKKNCKLLFMNRFIYANISSKTWIFSIVYMKFRCHINNLVWQME